MFMKNKDLVLKRKFFAYYGKNQLLSSTLFHAKAQSPQRKTKISFLRILASLRLCERILFNSGLSGLGWKKVK